MLRVTDATMPIICLQTAGRITRDDIDRAKPFYDRAYGQNRPFIALNDARLANYDAGQRALWAEWTAYSAKHDPGATKATIMIFDNPFLRGALTALNWIAPHRIPQYAVANVVEAIEVARKHVESDGLLCRAEVWGHIRYWVDQGHAQAVAG